MNPQDQSLIKAVLESKGWKQPQRGHVDVRDCLFSLDACHEVFEHDAPDGYWELLYETILHTLILDKKPKQVGSTVLVHVNMMNAAWTAVAKATPQQRCEAWLEFVKDQTK